LLGEVTVPIEIAVAVDYVREDTDQVRTVRKYKDLLLVMAGTGLTPNKSIQKIT
jgi:hypothetical protein